MKQWENNINNEGKRDKIWGVHILTTWGKYCFHYFKTLFFKQHWETAKTAQPSNIGINYFGGKIS